MNIERATTIILNSNDISAKYAAIGFLGGQDPQTYGADDERLVEPLANMLMQQKHKSCHSDILLFFGWSGFINNSRVVDAFKYVLRNRTFYNADVRCRAVRSLGVLAQHMAVDARGEGFTPHETELITCELKSNVPPELFEKVLQILGEVLLTDPDEKTRTFAAYRLSWPRRKEAVPYLLPALQDKSFNVRSEVAFSLAKLGNMEGFEQLLEGLLVKGAIIDRDHVPYLLAVIGDARAIKPLIKLMRYPGDLLGTMATRAKRTLYSFEQEDVIDAIAELLRNPRAKI